jgi:hypothetical protein
LDNKKQCLFAVNFSMSKAKRSKGRKIAFFVFAFSIASFLALLTGEILCRKLWMGAGYISDERNLTYRYDEELGWFPIRNSQKKFMGARLITVKHNSDGFRDKNHGVKNKKRIAFLGDSFVWGYDAEQHERFTDKLQLLLPEFEIINMGVSGYGTDQEFLLAQKWFDHYQPDIVVLIFTETDWFDNNDNYVYNGYYKPLYDVADGKLVIKGIPVRKSLNYYYHEYPFLAKSHMLQMLIKGYERTTSPRRDLSNDVTFEIIKKMKEYVESKGAKFKLVFAFNFDYEKKASLCKSADADCLFLGDNDMGFTQGGHWSPKGNDSVSAKLYRSLVEIK